MSEEERCITDDLSDIDTEELIDCLNNYFESSGDIKRTAYLNWRFDSDRDIENQFFDMAKGYFETSIALLENCIADNHAHKADIWIFPIMFNVVHGIEVYLKGFNSLYQILTKFQQDEYQETKIEGKHDIKQLCQVAVKLLRDSNNTALLKEMLFVQKFIEILYENTDDMTFARYPISSKGKKQFYAEDKGNVAIDLDVFRQWILRVFNIFYNCTGYIDFQIDQIKDYQAEMQRYFGEY